MSRAGLFGSAGLLTRGVPLVLEAGAVALVLAGRGADGAGLHALAAALAFMSSLQGLRSGASAEHGGAARIAPAIPSDAAAAREAAFSAAASAAVLVLSLPLVGAALLAFVAWPSWRRRPERASRALLEVALPDGAGELDEAPLERAAGVRSIPQLLRDAESPDERVRAVMTLRHMDARRAVPLLRLAFAHENEDVRLLAFGILEQREKRLRARIEQNQRGLANAWPRPARWHRRLARDHWELVYGGFVSGDLEPAVLAHAREHAEAALAREPDAKMAVLLARIELRRRQPQAAEAQLERALRAGLPRASATPLLAEAAFQRRRFGEIATILRGVQRVELRRPELEPVADYWVSEA